MDNLDIFATNYLAITLTTKKPEMVKRTLLSSTTMKLMKTQPKMMKMLMTRAILISSRSLM